MSISVLGSSAGSFVQIGQPCWISGGLAELDTLEIVWQGIYSKLDAFRATLRKWAPATVDNSMFLESFPDDGDLIKPKVTLRFIGFKGGVAPAGKKESGETVQSTSSTKSFSTTGIGGGTSASFTAEIVYYSPTSVYTWLSTSKGSGGAADTPSGSIRLISARIGGADVPSESTSAVLNNYFENQTTSVIQSEELVPGKYWRNTNIKSLIKIPIALKIT